MQIREHRPQDMLTQLCPTAYVPDASCPRWEHFLDEVFLGDAQLVRFVQKYLGYSLTGSTVEQCVAIFYGDGANGKSTLVNTVLEVLGTDYACKAPRELLLSAKGSQHPTLLATLFRKRLVVAIETGESARLDEVAIKELTGGDPITCRRMREDFWTYLPTHKIVLVTNHRPEVKGTDNAVWRRIRLVPFNARFSDGKQDPDLKEKLVQEASGILRWMVDGCRLWRKEGLGESEAVKQATEAYRIEEDSVGMFLADRCEAGEGRRVGCDQLMADYTLWSTLNRRAILSGKAFGTTLGKKGFELDETKKFRVGLSLRGSR